MSSASNTVIVLTAGQSYSILACLLMPLLLALGVVFMKKTARTNRGIEPDWSIPAIDAQAQGASLFHTWAPAVKIGTLLLCCFLIASLRSLLWSGVALAVALLAVHLTQIPWQRSLRRLAAMSGFLLMFLVILPFTSPLHPDDTVLLFPLLHSWPFRWKGFLLALTVILKATSVALLMEPMLATSSLSRTLQGFSALGLPPVLTQMVLLCHRYLFVFQQEITRMQRSVRVRGFVPGTNLATMRTMGNCFGMLFIRSFERTERVHEAMLCRGYQGALPTGLLEKITPWDLVKGAVCSMIGCLLLTLDRIFPVLWP
jgi:cobalt/nickel transport system permease protein